MDPPTPHDALVKSVFGDPAHAAGELQHMLPTAITERIDWSTLATVSGSFVDQALRGTHSDLLFTAHLTSGHDALLYLLFEHQSTDRPLMALTLLRYIVRVWDQHLRLHPEADKIPAILPLVLHHSERGWRAPTSLHGILDLDAAMLPLFAPYVPSFTFLLDDISAQPDEALHQRAMSALGRLVLFCLRHAREPWVLVGELARWLDLVGEVRAAPGGREALERIWRYIFVTSNPADPRRLVEHLVKVVGKESEEDVMTIADWLRSEGHKEGIRAGRDEGLELGRKEGRKEGLDEGRKEGLDEGRKEGRDEGRAEMGRKILLKQLQARFGQVPADAAARIQAADAEQLDVWLDRVITAATLDEVLASA